MSRVLALFFTLLLLWAGVAQANQALTGAHVYLFAGGLFVTYAALALPLRGGLAASMLAGAVCDAHAPVPFGTHLLLFAAAHTLIFTWRERLPRDRAAGRVGVALTVNGALFLAFAILRGGPSPGSAHLWLRLGADLACSQVFLALVAPWFFALQDRTLALLPADPERMF